MTPGPRHGRSWLDDGPHQPHAPIGPGQGRCGLLIALAVSVVVWALILGRLLWGGS